LENLAGQHGPQVAWWRNAPGNHLGGPGPSDRGFRVERGIQI